MKVLIVDDARENRYLLEQELRARGLAVQSAANGVEALEALQHDSFDLIISDILMPEMDGFQLCYALKHDARWKQIPFIFYTATYTDAEDEELGLRLGAEAFILKPAEPNAFFREVEAVFARGKTNGYKTATQLSCEDEVTFLKQYSARVVRKLEKKVQETEAMLRERDVLVGELNQARDELATHARNLERQVAERTATLQELVSDLEHFSYTITHDMRGPLRGIQAFAEMLEETCGACREPDALGFLKRIQTSAYRMDALIRDALNYSQAARKELPLGPVDAGALLRGMVDTYPEFQVSKADIVVDGEIPLVIGNEAGLTQVFSNLLGNAVKFVKPGEKPRVRVWADQQDGWARICFEDQGIGISAKALPRIFDMFTRGQGSYEGTGIGLALVRKVMGRMGGQVDVESEEGKGSRFCLKLRLVEKSH